MNPYTTRWLAGLRAYLARQTPIDEIPLPSDAAACEARRVLVDSMRWWSAEELPRLLAARSERLLAGLPQVEGDPDPAVVLTTTPAGLAAAAEVFAAEPPAWLVVLAEVEYRRWCRVEPDEAHAHHVCCWNWLKTHVPPKRWGEFAAWPLGEGEVYWLHRVGAAGVAADEIRRTRLLAFDGTRSRVLAEDVRERAFE